VHKPTTKGIRDQIKLSTESNFLSLEREYCMDREEKVSIKGDEPTVHQKGRRSLYTHSDATSTLLNQGLNLLTITTSDNCNNNNNELYNFSRYGNEWPS